MARFILDIANVHKDTHRKKITCHKKLMKRICDDIISGGYTSGIITINCIEKTNKKQFKDKLVKVKARVWS